jgi:hypothetical protein
VNGEGEGGWIWLMYFVFCHENRTVNSVEIVLLRGGRLERMMEIVRDGCCHCWVLVKAYILKDNLFLTITSHGRWEEAFF